MDALLKAGEFARLCRTTKETLRHYDRIGLLSPTMRGENGYKLYSFMQLVDFSLISALQSAGLSLAEVRDFLEKPESPRLQLVLEERVAVIEEQRRALAAKQRTLESALDQSRYLAAWLEGDGEPTEGGRRWRVRVCPEEYFIEGAIPYSEDREEDFLAAVHEHMWYCEQKGWASSFQEAYRVDEAHAMERSYAEGLCAEERVPKKVSSDRLRVKPAGTYLQLLNHIDLTAVQEELGADVGRDADAVGGSAGEAAAAGSTNPMFAAYDELHAVAERNGWRLTGDLYDVVLSIYAGNRADAIYTEVSMRLAQ